MTWSPQQEQALKRVSEWIKSGDEQIFRLFGFAGTGKTTLATHFAEDVDGDVIFGAFTGKAAHVLRSKGCHNASTIHSMIYKLIDDAKNVPQFRLNPQSPVKKAKLVIIDECSMVDEKLGRDLMSFGTKILVLGDPAQLPPVKGAGFFTSAKPDVMLTEIHRQARDNPIIQMAMSVREGHRLEIGNYGESRVIQAGTLTTADAMGADQVLVGINRTRRSYNARLRTLKGFETRDPELNDRLVCLRNNHEKGLLNGSIWIVEKILDRPVLTAGNATEMIVSPEDGGEDSQHVEVNVLQHFFEGRERDLDWHDRRESDEFDFGYALTVHKAQGSQWNEVLLFDESGAFREDRNRWLYTGITRAAERLTVVI